MGGARAEEQVGSHLGALVWSQTQGVSRVQWPGVVCFSLGAEGGVCGRVKGQGLFCSFFLSDYLGFQELGLMLWKVWGLYLK